MEFEIGAQVLVGVGVGVGVGRVNERKGDNFLDSILLFSSFTLFLIFPSLHLNIPTLVTLLSFLSQYFSLYYIHSSFFLSQ